MIDVGVSTTGIAAAGLITDSGDGLGVEATMVEPVGDEYKELEVKSEYDGAGKVSFPFEFPGKLEELELLFESLDAFTIIGLVLALGTSVASFVTLFRKLVFVYVLTFGVIISLSGV